MRVYRWTGFDSWFVLSTMSSSDTKTSSLSYFPVEDGPEDDNTVQSAGLSFARLALAGIPIEAG